MRGSYQNGKRKAKPEARKPNHILNFVQSTDLMIRH